MLYWSVFILLLWTCYAQLKQYGQFSEIQWHQCLSLRHSMGLVLYLPYSTLSFPRCSNIWTRHVLWHSIHSWQEENWRIYRQQLTDLNTAQENKGRIDYDNQVGQKVLVQNNSSLCKEESRYLKEPWTITSVHTNGTVRVQCRNKSKKGWISRE